MAKRLPVYRAATKTNASQKYNAREFEERHGDLSLTIRTADLRRLAADLSKDDLQFVANVWSELNATTGAAQ